jgi:hypothetical protein
VVEGIALGARVVVEGAQNLRPDSVVVEAGGSAMGKKTVKPAGPAPSTTGTTDKATVQPDSTGKL